MKAVNSTNPVTIPCGKCIGCKIDRSQQWALRCMHEAQMHKKNSFITLTFSKEHLPDDYSVNVRTWQLFMKRLRKQYGPHIRFFACGEYGDLNLRPHYHALLFNHDFNDKIIFKTNQSHHSTYSHSNPLKENNLYTSQQLTNLWSYGHCTIGDVTYESAAYTARYCMKKITGDKAPDNYWREHPYSKEMVRVQPEFAVQSRRPGLGATWLEKYKADVFPSDFIVLRGKQMAVPRYYEKQLTEGELEKLKRDRKRNGLPYKVDKTPQRLRVREAVKQSKLNRLRREL